MFAVPHHKSILCTLSLLIASGVAVVISASVANASVDHAPLLVRVRLEHKADQIVVRGHGLIVQGENRSAIPIAIPHGGQGLVIQHVVNQGHMQWKVSGELSKFFGERALHIHGQELTLDGKNAPEDLILYGGKAFDVVGVTSLNDYIAGVVAKEMPTDWPLEALKAQAVAVRSYTLAVLRERRNESFDVESSIMDQVYTHLQSREWQSLRLNKVRIAVVSTAGQTLKNRQGEVIKAFYHADCGGKTSSSQAVFGVDGVRGGIVDKSCPLNPRAHWHYAIAPAELVAKLGARAPANAELTKIDIQRVQAKDRVQNFTLHFADGKALTLPGVQLRQMLGYQNIKSTLVNVEFKQNKVEFQGIGFGHGVGLCQWGAKSLAAHGQQYAQILAHYYPDAFLERQERAQQLQASKDLQGEETHSQNDEQFLDRKTL